MSLLPPVLLIDEDGSDRDLLAVVLGGAFGGVQLEMVRNSAEFARLLTSGQFGLVLTEHELSWIRSNDVVRLMRDLKPGCPVIIVTSQPLDKVASEVLHLGIDGLVPKTSSGYSGLPNIIRSTLFRARRRAALASPGAPYRRLMDALPSGVFTATRDGTILEANPALADLLGYRGAEFLAQRGLSNLFVDESEAAGWFTKLQSTAGVLVTEPLWRRADGGTAWVRLSAWTAPDRDGGGRQLQGLVQEIADTRGTRREPAAEAPTAEAATAANPGEELKELAYVACHDLRQPLTQVIRYLDLLGEEAGPRLGSEAQTFLDHARSAAANLDRMVDGVLGLAQIETKGGVFAPVDLGAALARALESLGEIKEQVSAEVTWGALPTVMADASQMQQLFQNLLSNAFKFRRMFPPRVLINAEEKADHWHFWCKDFGIGLDPKDGERIFTMFQRLHTDAEYPGSGIGLAVCRRIVARHGGRIWVDSQPDRGATFHFTLSKRLAAVEAGREEHREVHQEAH